MQYKRSYKQFKDQGAQRKRRTLKRQDKEDENLIEKGGSSQDKFESDFIDDDASDQEAEYQVGQKKSSKYEDGLPDDEEDEPEYMTEQSEEEDRQKTKKTQVSNSKLSKTIQQSDDDDEEESDTEIYEKLPRTEEFKNLEIDYRYRGKDKQMYLPGDYCIPKTTYDRLFDHQKQGIQWLYYLWRQDKGGVLGDDMGLGKTVQVSVYLQGLFQGEFIKKVLIVVPATMKTYWEEELKKWCPACDNVITFDDKKKDNRYDQMKKLRKNGGILVTSYSMVSTERMNLTDMKYDIIIVDEGHKAKNRNTQFRKDITSLRVKGHRIILTGTPLQNNLSELWSVFDFV